MRALPPNLPHQPILTLCLSCSREPCTSNERHGMGFVEFDSDDLWKRKGVSIAARSIKCVSSSGAIKSVLLHMIYSSPQSNFINVNKQAISTSPVSANQIKATEFVVSRCSRYFKLEDVSKGIIIHHSREYY